MTPSADNFEKADSQMVDQLEPAQIIDRLALPYRLGSFAYQQTNQIKDSNSLAPTNGYSVQSTEKHDPNSSAENEPSELVEFHRKLNDKFAGLAPRIGALPQEALSSAGNTDMVLQDEYQLLGEGVSNTVFGVTLDGMKYVVKVPKHDLQMNTGDKQISAYFRAQGVSHLEQVIALSDEKGVVVSEHMPGTPINKISLEAMADITAEQFREVLHTMHKAQAVGISFDFSPANVLYDAKAGFGFVDLDSSDNASFISTDDASNAVEFADLLMGLVTGFNNKGRRRSSLTKDDYVSRAQKSSACLPLVVQYKAVCEDMMESESIDYTYTIDRLRDYISVLYEYKNFANVYIV